jgi:hypothetical protein
VRLRFISYAVTSQQPARHSPWATPGRVARFKNGQRVQGNPPCARIIKGVAKPRLMPVRRAHKKILNIKENLMFTNFKLNKIYLIARVANA